MGVIFKKLCGFTLQVTRHYTESASCRVHKCKLLVVGAGTGGCSVAWRFSRQLNPADIIVLEPSEFHHYQPLFTLVAAGIKSIELSQRPLRSVLPPRVAWLRDHAETFDPCNNLVHTRCGHRIKYEYMVVAVGMKNDYDKIPGLKSALDDPASAVCTIYAAQYCAKTWRCVRRARGGHTLFTYTRRAAKCSGAAQKIMYLADDYFRQNKVRNLIDITYNTGGDAIFGVDRYARALTAVASDRGVAVNCRVELEEVAARHAVFRVAGGETVRVPFSLLHVTPPMSAPACVACSRELAPRGSLAVDARSLRHARYGNVFGLGDCTDTPNSKTAAAVAQQSYVVECNLLSVMYGKPMTARYDGYGACPILTSYKRGILAEFLYDKQPCETFPFDQSKENRFVYYLKRDYFPHLYWNKLIKGKWNGPAKFRKIINLFGR